MTTSPDSPHEFAATLSAASTVPRDSNPAHHQAPPGGLSRRTADTPDSDPLIGQQLGTYRITGVLGQGGMGKVYCAEHQSLRRPAAIKLLPAETAHQSEALRRFQKEAEAAARLTHPNVVAVYDFAQTGQTYYLAMEYVAGGAASEHLATVGAFPWPEATRIVADVCRALMAAHGAGLIHRDIKPSNILLAADGMVKLTDFGLVKLNESGQSGQTVSINGQMMGSPPFMSPEQCSNTPVDHRCDIYSLGATYFTLLTGQPPFDGRSVAALVYAHCFHPIPDLRSSRPDLPAGAAMIILRAMAKRPEDRYASAGDMLTDLEALLRIAAYQQSSNLAVLPPVAASANAMRPSTPVWVGGPAMGTSSSSSSSVGEGGHLGQAVMASPRNALPLPVGVNAPGGLPHSSAAGFVPFRETAAEIPAFAPPTHPVSSPAGWPSSGIAGWVGQPTLPAEPARSGAGPNRPSPLNSNLGVARNRPAPKPSHTLNTTLVAIIGVAVCVIVGIVGVMVWKRSPKTPDTVAITKPKPPGPSLASPRSSDHRGSSDHRDDDGRPEPLPTPPQEIPPPDLSRADPPRSDPPPLPNVPPPDGPLVNPAYESDVAWTRRVAGIVDLNLRVAQTLKRLRLVNPQAAKCHAEFNYDPNASSLILKMCGIHFQDLSPLRALTGVSLRLYLDAFDQDRRPIGKIDSLDPLANLEVEALDLGGQTQLRNFKPLASSKRLRVLLAPYTAVGYDLASLRGVPLNILNVAHAGVREVTPLAEITTLERLNLSGNALSDISPLAGLPLQQLILDDTQIRDIAVLQNLQTLEFLSLNRLQLANYDALRQLPRLRTLLALDMPPAKFAALHGLPLRELKIGPFDAGLHGELLRQLPQLETFDGQPVGQLRARLAAP